MRGGYYEHEVFSSLNTAPVIGTEKHRWARRNKRKYGIRGPGNRETTGERADRIRLYEAINAECDNLYDAFTAVKQLCFRNRLQLLFIYLNRQVIGMTGIMLVKNQTVYFNKPSYYLEEAFHYSQSATAAQNTVKLKQILYRIGHKYINKRAAERRGKYYNVAAPVININNPHHFTSFALDAGFLHNAHRELWRPEFIINAFNYIQPMRVAISNACNQFYAVNCANLPVSSRTRSAHLGGRGKTLRGKTLRRKTLRKKQRD